MEDSFFIEYWQRMREKMSEYKKKDIMGVIFGAKTRGRGHNYDILPVVSEAEINAFEKKNKITIPGDYRTFLQFYGAGGAGPHYGIYDFRSEHIKGGDFTKPFQYTASLPLDDLEEDHPLYEFQGLACIATRGCGSDYYIELNGPNPGQMWCYWQEEFTKEPYGSFYHFYDLWVKETEVRLERSYKLIAIKHQKYLGLFPKKLTFEDIVEAMDCSYSENRYKDEVRIFFEKTKGMVVLDQNQKVLDIRLDCN